MGMFCLHWYHSGCQSNNVYVHIDVSKAYLIKKKNKKKTMIYNFIVVSLIILQVWLLRIFSLLALFMTLEFDQGDMPAQNEEVEEAYCLLRFTKHLHLVEQMCDGKCKSKMKVNNFARHTVQLHFLWQRVALM